MKNFVLFCSLGLVFSLFAAVEIEHKKVQKNNREYNTFRILNSAPVKNTLNYNISSHKGVKTVGDRSSASTGIGLANGWYNSGSIRIFVDGKTLNMPAKVESKNISCNNANYYHKSCKTPSSLFYKVCGFLNTHNLV